GAQTWIARRPAQAGLAHAGASAGKSGARIPEHRGSVSRRRTSWPRCWQRPGASAIIARMEPDEEAALLGRIAVKYKFITLEQLAEATRERGRMGKKLGVIMLEKGMIDEFTLGKILALQQRHQKALERQREAR